MRRFLLCACVFGVVTVLCADVAAQIESHALPDSMPRTLLPPYVTRRPKRATRELSAPLLVEKKTTGTGATSSGSSADEALKLLQDDGGSSSNGGGATEEVGNPNATTLAGMSGLSRKVVDQAKAGRFKEAAEIAQKLLQLKKETFNDFVWDYVANAGAWSYVQLRDFKAAAEAHRAARKYVREPAVKDYHEKAATLLSRAVPTGADDTKAAEMADTLKDAAQYRRLLLKRVEQQLKLVKRGITQIKGARTAESRINSVKSTYVNLRVICAVDPETGRQLVAEFKAANDALITDIVAQILQKGRSEHADVVRWQSVPLKPSQIPRWNKQVKELWACVREAKRICRVYDYLSRLGLAGSANARTSFDAAHDLLYEPSRNRVYKLMGAKTSAGLDMKRTEQAPP